MGGLKDDGAMNGSMGEQIVCPHRSMDVGGSFVHIVGAQYLVPR